MEIKQQPPYGHITMPILLKGSDRNLVNGIRSVTRTSLTGFNHKLSVRVPDMMQIAIVFLSRTRRREFLTTSRAGSILAVFTYCPLFTKRRALRNTLFEGYICINEQTKTRQDNLTGFPPCSCFHMPLQTESEETQHKG